MSTEFWIGVVLSVPIGILTGIATPWFQKIFDNWNKSKLTKSRKNSFEEYQRVKMYKTSKEDSTHYYLSVIIKTTFIGAFVGLFSGALFVLGELVSQTGFGFQTILYSLGQFAALVGSLLIVNICRPAMLMWTRLRNFDEYENDLRKQGVIT